MRKNENTSNGFKLVKEGKTPGGRDYAIQVNKDTKRRQTEISNKNGSISYRKRTSAGESPKKEKRVMKPGSGWSSESFQNWKPVDKGPRKPARKK